MSYPAPPPAEQPPAARQDGSASPATGGSFFNDLFDFRFTRFVSLRLISIVYILILIAVSLGALVIVFAGFAQGGGTGVVALIFAAVGWLLYIILARVGLEAFAVLFRIHDDTSRMAHGVAGQGGATFAPPAPDFGGGAPTQVQQAPYTPGSYSQGGYGQGGYTPPPATPPPPRARRGRAPPPPPPPPPPAPAAAPDDAERPEQPAAVAVIPPCPAAGAGRPHRSASSPVTKSMSSSTRPSSSGSRSA